MGSSYIFVKEILFMKNLKVFISQPMNGRKEIDVLLERRVAITLLNDKGFDKYELEEIDNYHKTNIPTTAGRVYYLGDSVRQMDEADLVIFVKGWKGAKGCEIEYAICKIYGIPYVLMEELCEPSYKIDNTLYDIRKYRVDRGRRKID